DEMVIVAHSGHPFTLHPIEPGELCDETLLLREQGSGTRRYFELELERQGLKPRRVMEIGNTEAIKRTVAAGLGISAVPRRSVIEEQLRGSLGLVRVVGLDMQRPLGILTYKGIRLAPVALAFAAALQKASF
ncbi:MAG: LysR substrate-binding domain-containing protein, partial [Dehalococcoidia bacterium]|nr:LysR substrate-binding domain-containing protein [Dehalococcoidia bacterium]